MLITEYQFNRIDLDNFTVTVFAEVGGSLARNGSHKGTPMTPPIPFVVEYLYFRRGLSSALHSHAAFM